MSAAPEPGRPSRLLASALVAALALLTLLVFRLAATRIYQVDEAQNVMMARLIATGQSGRFLSSAPLMLLGPLVAIARHAGTSAGLFLAFRFVFAALLVLNVVLMAKGAGFSLRNRSGLLALLAAATLAPLWDYGFEIRHDNVLLACLLGIWILLRHGKGEGSLAGAGFLSALAQFVAFKAFLFWIPLLLAGALWRGGAAGTRRRRGIVLLVAGLVAGALAARFAHALAGTWELYLSDLIAARDVSAGELRRLPPWSTLGRLVTESPLLVFASFPSIWLLGRGVLRNGWRSAVDPQGSAPELAFAGIGLAAFLANPTPFPYNLVLLVPPLFVLVGRSVREVEIPATGALVPVGLVLLAAAHLVPWGIATRRHLAFTNARQVELMGLAERLTDPARQAVFDGSGLVPTRNPPGRYWLLHTFTIGRLSDGTWPSVRSSLAAVETPVILPSYRTEWLPPADQAFLRAHYVGMASDLLLLGFVDPDGERAFEALANGRYRLALDGSSPGETVEIDGAPVPPGVVTLKKGEHRFRRSGKGGMRLVWLGAELDDVPQVGEAPGPLFVNWY
jgi:hypothetical protein